MSYILAPRNRPLRLRPDNFTPPARTPWGGQRIVERYKSAHGVSSEGVVGESWELGVEPDFPTRLADGRTLADVIAEDPEGLVGDEGTSTALLVKLLDAAEPLWTRALEVTERKNLLAIVNMARTYAVKRQDREMYVSLLREVLEAGDVAPEQRLTNMIAKRRAARYLRLVDERFPR